MDKMKEIKEIKEKKQVKQKRRKVDNLSKEKRDVKEGVHLKSANETKIKDAKIKKKHDQKQSKTHTRKYYEAGRWMNYNRDCYEDEGWLNNNYKIIITTTREVTIIMDPVNLNEGKMKCEAIACQSTSIEFERYRQQCALIGRRDYIGRCN